MTGPRTRRIRLVVHARGAPCLALWPGGLKQLCELFNRNSTWAQGRSTASLRRMLWGSQVVVSAWDGKTLIAFGRATSDGVFRAVLWDVVVERSYQQMGVGSKLVKAILETKRIKDAEQVSLMTTDSAGFYLKLGFEEEAKQRLLKKRK